MKDCQFGISPTGKLFRFRNAKLTILHQFVEVCQSLFYLICLVIFLSHLSFVLYMFCLSTFCRYPIESNVAKCHSMRVTRHLPENQIQFEYSLHQQRLEQVQSAKYLGITITDNLDWGQHVSEISSKATKTMGFLRRNLALAPRHTKEVAYKTLVRPQLEYAAPIWHPYHDTQIAQVEKVQRMAEAIRTTVVPIRILIRTTVVPITPLIGTTVLRIRILIGTTGI